MVSSIEYVEHKGLYIPKEAAKKKPLAFDLFAGCGGFSLGLIQAGFEVVGAVEWEPYAALTYMTNLGSYPINIHYVEPEDKERLNAALEKQLEYNERYHNKGGIYRFDAAGSGWIRNHPEASPVRHFWFGDIRKIKGQDILDALRQEPGDIDCVCGGPPCQGFSMAGKRNVMDPRNSLVFDFARMILELQPKTFVMENVPGIVSMITPEGIPVVDAFCLMLSEGGYGAYEGLKKALLASSGAGAAVKGATGRKNYKKPKKEEREVEQISLLEMSG